MTAGSQAVSPGTARNLLLSLGGVIQEPDTDYTVLGSTLTFTTAPTAGSSFFGVVFGDMQSIATPSDGTVLPASIASSGDFAFPADVRLKDSDGSHYVGFQAASTVSSNVVWTLPSADAAASGYALVSNASGVLSWAEMTSGITIQEEGSSLSTAATTLNFVGSSVTATGSGATKTITVTGGGVTSDAQENTVAGTNAGSSFSGTDALDNTLFGYDAGAAITTGDNNTFFGHSAGKAVNTAAGNTCIGYDAGKSMTTAEKMVAIGTYALDSQQTGYGNVALGYAALNGSTTGQRNIAIGYYAMAYGNLTSSSLGNIAIGEGALVSARTGSQYNIAIGYEAGYNATTNNNNILIGSSVARYASGTSFSGASNVVMGNSAFYSATNAELNVAIGQSAMNSISSGDFNVVVGASAGRDITTGNKNVLVGYEAGNTGTNDLTTGANNIIIGYEAAASSATVSNEVTIGDTNITKFRVPGLNFVVKDSTATDNYVLTVDANGECGWEAAAGGGLSSDAQGNTVGGTNAGDSFSGTDAVKNTLFGYNAGTGITTKDNNTAFGYDALTGDGGNNTAFGYEALKVNAGSSFLMNVAVGGQALKALTTGNQNVAVGQSAGIAATTGSRNTLVGLSAGTALTTGGYHTFIGWNSGYKQITGYANTAVGYYSLWNSTESEYNVAIGYRAALDITTGDNNVVIGTDAGNTGTNDLTTGSNNILIGHDAAASSATVSNEVTIGDTNITKFRIPGINVVLKDNGGTPTDGHVLTVDSNGEAGFAISSLASDAFNNTVGGTDALTNASSGTDANTAFGKQALTALNGGQYSDAFGYQALRVVTTGIYNASFGCFSGYSVSTGSDNTLLGYYSGNNITTGSNNIVIGKATTASSATVSNEITLGNSSITKFRIPGLNFDVDSSGINITAATPEISFKANSVADAGQIKVYESSGGGAMGFLTKDTSGTETERFRVNPDGRFLVGTSVETFARVCFKVSANNEQPFSINDSSNTSTMTSRIGFRTGNNQVGTIKSSSSATQYNTSSDYRLKENAVSISDGITRIKTLKPYKFNWIIDETNTPVDGFFAHEVSGVVPEAISGTKDKVADAADVARGDANEVGDPVHQQIDQSKLVPLLTAALQEAITKIEVLETKVATLEAA